MSEWINHWRVPKYRISFQKSFYESQIFYLILLSMINLSYGVLGALSSLSII